MVRVGCNSILLRTSNVNILICKAPSKTEGTSGVIRQLPECSAGSQNDEGTPLDDVTVLYKLQCLYQAVTDVTVAP